LHSATIRVDLRREIGAIDKNIYGHFVEHLGRCVEEGIWVGEDSAIPNEDGIRSDVAGALRAISIPVIRWPGGCFADAYNWRDGIGPRQQRPRRVNLWWAKEEDNQFGTDEFVRFCRMTGAEPYICGNVGSGSPREMVEWLEYCNYAGDTALARQRAANGSPQPYGVKYWGVGNENWGCGGAYEASEYAREYRRYATYLRRMDPAIELVACGYTPEWNLEFLEKLGRPDLVDHLSIHHYYASGPAQGFSDEEYYNLFVKALQLEEMIEQTTGLLSFFGRGARRIKLAIDEWGAWHPQATLETHLYQESTLRDAVCAAVLLDVFNRHCNAISMTNIAQTINVLQCLIQTAGEQMWLTPTYHVYNLYQPHMQATALEAEIECASMELANDEQRRSLPLVSGSASVSPDRQRLCVTFSNLHLDDKAEVSVHFVGAGRSADAKLRVLVGERADSANGSQAPEAVRVQSQDVQYKDGVVSCVLPPHSTAALTVTTHPGL